MQSRQIFTRMYRAVLDSARRFPTISAKMRPIDQTKDRVLSGPKQSLVKWPLNIVDKKSYITMAYLVMVLF